MDGRQLRDRLRRGKSQGHLPGNQISIINFQITLTLTIFSISKAWLGNFMMSFPMAVSSFGWQAVLFTYTLPLEYRRIRTLPASSILILTPWNRQRGGQRSVFKRKRIRRRSPAIKSQYKQEVFIKVHGSSGYGVPKAINRNNTHTEAEAAKCQWSIIVRRRTSSLVRSGQVAIITILIHTNQ